MLLLQTNGRKSKPPCVDLKQLSGTEKGVLGALGNLTWSSHAADRGYLLGDGESDDGIPLQDLPCHHGRVDFNLSDGHIERSWQQGVWQRCAAQNEHPAYKCYTFLQCTAPSGSHILIPNPPLVAVIPVLINLTLSLEISSCSSVLYILPSLLIPLASSSHARLIKSWLMRLYFLPRAAVWF